MAALLTLAGCWPYVSGNWTDYLPPDAFEPVPVQVAGHATWTTFVGDYWEEENPLDEGTFTWGWLAEADPAFVAWSWQGAPVDGCIDADDLDDEALHDLFARPDLEDDDLVGPLGDIILAPDDDAPVMAGALRAGDLVEGYPYGWPGLTVGNVEVAADVLFRFLPLVQTNGPDLATEDLAPLDADALVWTWDPVDTPQRVSAWVLLVDDDGDLRDGRLCSAQGSAGVLDLSDSWGAARDGDVWYVRLTTTHVNQAFFAEEYGAASVLVERAVLGAAARE